MDPVDPDLVDPDPVDPDPDSDPQHWKAYKIMRNRNLHSKCAID